MSNKKPPGIPDKHKPAAQKAPAVPATPSPAPKTSAPAGNGTAHAPK